MGFQATAGRILITDPADANHVVFDTDDRLLVFTDLVSGSVDIPQRQSTSQNGSRTEVNVDVDTVCSSINAAATVVLGAFQTSFLDGYPDPTGWFQATGSLMHSRIVINATGNASGGSAVPPWTSVSGHQILTFRAASGQLILNERTFLRCTRSLGSTLITATFPAATITFKLFCGTFV